MKIVMMLTADYAAVEPQSGKLNIIGVFNRIRFESFPASHRRMYLALKLEGEFTDRTEPQDLRVALAGEDGNELLAIEGQIEMPEGTRGMPPQLGMVFELNQLKFSKPGDYRFYLNVGEWELDASTALQVVQADA